MNDVVAVLIAVVHAAPISANKRTEDPRVVAVILGRRPIPFPLHHYCITAKANQQIIKRFFLFLTATHHFFPESNFSGAASMTFYFNFTTILHNFSPRHRP